MCMLSFVSGKEVYLWYVWTLSGRMHMKLIIVLSFGERDKVWGETFHSICWEFCILGMYYLAKDNSSLEFWGFFVLSAGISEMLNTNSYIIQKFQHLFWNFKMERSPFWIVSRNRSLCLNKRALSFSSVTHLLYLYLFILRWNSPSQN